MNHKKFRVKLSRELLKGARALEHRAGIKTIARMTVESLEDANWAEAYRYLARWLIDQEFNTHD